MKMALPPLIPTLCAHITGNHMRVDNVFCDEILYEAITIYNTDEESRPFKSDHFPIITQVPHLGPLFWATNTIEYYPKDWATTDTLVLKKPGKLDYTVLSAWWPIVLSDGLGRLLNSCQAMDLVNMCKKFNILPANHFRARPGRTTSDSIHLLTKTVKDAWWKGQVVSILFLDVKSAFPTVDINCLVHNMKKKVYQYNIWIGCEDDLATG